MHSLFPYRVRGIRIRILVNNQLNHLFESSEKLNTEEKYKKRAIYLNGIYKYIVRARLFFSPALQTNSMKRVWNTNYVKAAVNTVARSNSTHSVSTWIIRERPANRSKFSTPLWLRDSHRPTKQKIKGQRNGRQREEGERRCLKAYFAVRNAAKEGWNAPLGNSNYRGAFSLFFFFSWHVAKLFSLSPLFHFPTVFFPILIMTNNSVYLDI